MPLLVQEMATAPEQAAVITAPHHVQETMAQAAPTQDTARAEAHPYETDKATCAVTITMATGAEITTTITIIANKTTTPCVTHPVHSDRADTAEAARWEAERAAVVVADEAVIDKYLWNSDPISPPLHGGSTNATEFQNTAGY